MTKCSVWCVWVGKVTSPKFMACAAIAAFISSAAGAQEAPNAGSAAAVPDAQQTSSLPQTSSLQQMSSIQLGPSGLPLPRFVSLKSAKVNARTGPGVNYSVEWLYMKAGLPVEILQEFDNWRRIRDSEGAEGWVNQTLLSGRRTAIVAPWQAGKTSHINLLDSPDGKASVAAMIEPGVIGRIHTCNGKWCEMIFNGHKGWMTQSLLWGAYPDEQVEE